MLAITQNSNSHLQRRQGPLKYKFLGPTPLSFCFSRSGVGPKNISNKFLGDANADAAGLGSTV